MYNCKNKNKNLDKNIISKKKFKNLSFCYEMTYVL